MAITKAYKNEVFLNSEKARSIRILCEYSEPEQRFDRLGVRQGVIFFGSARTRSIDGQRDYYREAAALGERLARWTVDTHAAADRFHLITGGGPGIMQAGHEGAARVDRSLNIGLNISLPFEQHVNPHVQEDHAVEFHYFFLRKFWFLKLARAAVIFPGGFGTLDELFELLTLTQTGKSAPMPIILYGKEFWEGVVNFQMLADRGLISPEDLQLYSIQDDVDSAFERLRDGLEAPPLDA
ncbi:LOG family protein [Polycyclovorans algicola]|uniref:LOG family protein n=1 Tax=Polycyclovorans algicola TaxID=616992 RepID=UPI0004A6BFD7|nr:LOG family protein [Polycyclovorans algicola]